MGTVTIEFTEKAVKKYLDKAIRHARRERDLEGSIIARFYVDAFQSVRVSLFGESLEEDCNTSSERVLFKVNHEVL